MGGAWLPALELGRPLLSARLTTVTRSSCSSATVPSCAAAELDMCAARAAGNHSISPTGALSRAQALPTQPSLPAQPSTAHATHTQGCHSVSGTRVRACACARTCARTCVLRLRVRVRVNVTCTLTRRPFTSTHTRHLRPRSRAADFTH
ncbi:hypothetical protein T492DRAFT_1110135, partial [Pavlovales sp. CCMP2436]